MDVRLSIPMALAAASSEDGAFWAAFPTVFPTVFPTRARTDSPRVSDLRTANLRWRRIISGADAEAAVYPVRRRPDAHDPGRRAGRVRPGSPLDRQTRGRCRGVRVAYQRADDDRRAPGRGGVRED